MGFILKSVISVSPSLSPPACMPTPHLSLSLNSCKLFMASYTQCNNAMDRYYPLRYCEYSERRSQLLDHSCLVTAVETVGHVPAFNTKRFAVYYSEASLATSTAATAVQDFGTVAGVDCKQPDEKETLWVSCSFFVLCIFSV